MRIYGLATGRLPVAGVQPTDCHLCDVCSGSHCAKLPLDGYEGGPISVKHDYSPATRKHTTIPGGESVSPFFTPAWISAMALIVGIVARNFRQIVLLERDVSDLKAGRIEDRGDIKILNATVSALNVHLEKLTTLIEERIPKQKT